jgi:hypothetical protein
MFPGESRVVTPPGSFQHPKPFGHHLAADSIPFNDCNLVSVHYNSSVFRIRQIIFRGSASRQA